jgi:DNA-binding NtrC family response regulator
MAEFFFQKFSKELKKPQLIGFSQQAIKCILAHNWPGNVRELINRIKRALVMCESRLIIPADLDLEEKNISKDPVDLKSIRARNEKEKIQEVLEKTAYNISKGALILGISRVTLYSMIRRYEIEVNPKKKDSFLNEPRLVH